MSRENFFRTCNNMNVPEKDFREIFCNRCKNPRCELAQGGDSRWANRVLTQEDRLLRNPKFADTNDPRFNNIKTQQFISLINEAIELNTQERVADWNLKWESAQPQMFIPPPQGSNEETVAKVQEPIVEVPVESEVSILKLPVKESTPEPNSVKTAFLNTPFPSEGVMIDGSPVPTQVPKPQTPPSDPWAVPTKPTNVVPVGAKVVMGGSGGNKNGS